MAQHYSKMVAGGLKVKFRVSLLLYKHCNAEWAAAESPYGRRGGSASLLLQWFMETFGLRYILLPILLVIHLFKA